MSAVCLRASRLHLQLLAPSAVRADRVVRVDLPVRALVVHEHQALTVIDQPVAAPLRQSLLVSTLAAAPESGQVMRLTCRLTPLTSVVWA